MHELIIATIKLLHFVFWWHENWNVCNNKKNQKTKKPISKKYNTNLCCIVKWIYNSFYFSFQSSDVSDYVFPLQIIALTTS